jgi:hypothetical protein
MNPDQEEARILVGADLVSGRSGCRAPQIRNGLTQGEALQ